MTAEIPIDAECEEPLQRYLAGLDSADLMLQSDIGLVSALAEELIGLHDVCKINAIRPQFAATFAGAEQIKHRKPMINPEVTLIFLIQSKSAVLENALRNEAVRKHLLSLA